MQTLNSILAVLLIALQTADLWTTSVILNAGGREEARIMQWLIANFGRLGLAYSKLGVDLGVAACFAAWGATAGLAGVLGGLCIFYGVVVFRNAGEVRKNGH